MKDATEFAISASRAWLDAWFTGADALTTIACRLPILAADPLGREAQRMVSEKFSAAGEAALAAGAALTGLALTPARTSRPLRAAKGALVVFEVAAQPLRRRVRANARRLRKSTS